MNIADPYIILAGKHGYSDSQSYRRLLEFLMTPLQANIAIDLPLTIEEIASKHNISVEKAREEISILFRKGVVIPKNFQTLETPRFSRSAVQLHDATQSILDVDLYTDDEKKQLFYLWEVFSQEVLYPQRVSDTNEMEQPPIRIIPAYRSVKDVDGFHYFDDVREIVRAQNLIALCSCTCRKRSIVLDRACSHSHDVNCLQFNRGAEYAITRGSGRKITYEQALEVIDSIEDDGLVHNWRNERSMAHPILCSCCIDCCMVWHPIDIYKADIGKCWAKSRFVAEIKDDLCIGCRICEKRCMFGAVSMHEVPGTDKYKAMIDPERCFGCGVCVLKCKPGAISMKLVRPLEFIPEVGAAFSA